jgi:uncharacterized membrane protein
LTGPSGSDSIGAPIEEEGRCSVQEPSAQAPASSFRRVDSSHGVEWWSAAWKLLFNRGATAVWIVMWVIAFVIYLLLHIFHIIGSIVAHVGLFIMAGGMMLAARKTEQGTAPAIGDLFSGFGAPLGPLVIAGALVMAAALVVYGALVIAGAGALFAAFYAAMAGNVALLAGLGATSLLLLLVALVLLLPVVMAAWLAPALIVFRQQPPVEALKASLAACWANLGALTVYGLLGIVFSIIATVPFLLGWFVLGPLIVLSAYTTYRDLLDSQATS